MEAVRKEPGLYHTYPSIPVDDEKKFEWIYQQGGNYGHFEVPKRYYRLKTAEELTQDEIFVSEIKSQTIVATFGDMCYLDRLPKALHKYFDYTLVLRSDNETEKRVNAAEINNKPFVDFYKKNIIRNDSPIKF
jgi:hypothetical protein